METKTFTEFKTTDQGHVEAVFSTLNVIDSDRDVTLPGAFQDGAPILISAYGHSSWGGNPPVGKGVIRMDGDRALIDGQFFMDTAAGKDTFLTVKGMGDLGEWSYGFDVLKASSGQHDGEDVRFLEKLRVFEASPVLRGAGVGTRTIGTKSDGEIVLSLNGSTFGAIAAAELLRKQQSHDTPFSEQAAKVTADFAALLERAKAFGSSGDIDHSGLSAANRERLDELAKALGVARDQLDELLTDPTQGDDAIRARVLAEAARFHLTTGGNEHDHRTADPVGSARRAA